MTLKQQYQEVLKRLRRHYTRAPETFVRWKTPLELVVGTVLSAQCTDKRVNEVTKTLFKKYRTARAYARADLDTLKKQIYSIGFYNSKAKYLVGIGKRLVEAYEGKVPNTFDDLMTLPGVSRKTAHLVMSKAWQKPTGVAVDTHVRRIAPRLGWTQECKNVAKIERDLNALIAPRDYLDTNEYLIMLGRDLCRAKPNCAACPLNDICPTGRLHLTL
ncbi:hypothetical protein A3B32_02145 [Candidatus Uhrbacteria bacterium RIFCSPLOWO2_01_FULL_53_9]|uniref:Endonuclease III n=1 Tax=Candidatus Uhrbacteria bacterium RIFCSPLOWO2_01_FULL_53_9 TaxID=1802403 RepID=A0A1F7UXE9_9BACT|nr:MAG: hypothetical protein A3B32_02145 [Candidatus Uhrbacteria bacterium RIFCSPLOWO2_01_FULL_53_9]